MKTKHEETVAEAAERIRKKFIKTHKTLVAPPRKTK